MNLLIESDVKMKRGILKIDNNTYPTYEGSNLIGRNPKANVNIKDVHISQNHAVILIINEQLQYITDLGSSNGTKLNDNTLEALKLYPLKSSCLLSFGNVDAQYEKARDSIEVTGNVSVSQGFTQSIYCKNTQNIVNDIHNLPTQDFSFDINNLPTQNCHLQETELMIHELPTQSFPELENGYGELIEPPADFSNVSISESEEDKELEIATKIEESTLASNIRLENDDELVENMQNTLQKGNESLELENEESSRDSIDFSNQNYIKNVKVKDLPNKSIYELSDSDEEILQKTKKKVSVLSDTDSDTDIGEQDTQEIILRCKKKARKLSSDIEISQNELNKNNAEQNKRENNTTNKSVLVPCTQDVKFFNGNESTLNNNRTIEDSFQLEMTNISIVNDSGLNLTEEDNDPCCSLNIKDTVEKHTETLDNNFENNIFLQSTQKLETNVEKIRNNNKDYKGFKENSLGSQEKDNFDKKCTQITEFNMENNNVFIQPTQNLKTFNQEPEIQNESKKDEGNIENDNFIEDVEELEDDFKNNDSFIQPNQKCKTLNQEPETQNKSEENLVNDKLIEEGIERLEDDSENNVFMQTTEKKEILNLKPETPKKSKENGKNTQNLLDILENDNVNKNNKKRDSKNNNILLKRSQKFETLNKEVSEKNIQNMNNKEDELENKLALMFASQKVKLTKDDLVNILDSPKNKKKAKLNNKETENTEYLDNKKTITTDPKNDYENVKKDVENNELIKIDIQTKERLTEIDNSTETILKKAKVTEEISSDNDFDMVSSQNVSKMLNKGKPKQKCVLKSEETPKLRINLRSSGNISKLPDSEGKENNEKRKQVMKNEIRKRKFDFLPPKQKNSKNLRNRTVSVSSLTCEPLEKQRRLSANSRYNKKRQSISSDLNDSIASQRTKRKTRPKIVFTMLDNPELESIIRHLGGSVVDSIESCTVLITKSVKRTKKLLSAIGQAKPICSPEWIYECKKANQFLDPWDFILADQEAEDKWNFSLRESLNRSKRGKLLENYTFQICVDTMTDVLKSAIESSGGKCVLRGLLKFDNNLVIVGIESKKSKIRTIVDKKRNIIIVEPEAIFDGTLRQELNFDKYLIEL